jgi:hypothetical protein
MNETKNKIFRYKLSDDIMLNITQFAKIHQFADRHLYKEAWGRWLAANQDSVEREVSRLTQLEYKGDIIDKMFKAGRYYFREKAQTAAVKPAVAGQTAVQTVLVVVEKPKREYIVMSPTIIKAMDVHLKELIQQKDFKPALAYTQFCNQHVDLLREEIGRLVLEHTTITGAKMAAKFKKTYKNRHFMLQQR